MFGFGTNVLLIPKILDPCINCASCIFPLAALKTVHTIFSRQPTVSRYLGTSHPRLNFFPSSLLLRLSTSFSPSVPPSLSLSLAVAQTSEGEREREGEGERARARTHKHTHGQRERDTGSGSAVVSLSLPFAPPPHGEFRESGAKHELSNSFAEGTRLATAVPWGREGGREGRREGGKVAKSPGRAEWKAALMYYIPSMTGHIRVLFAGAPSLNRRRSRGPTVPRSGRRCCCCPPGHRSCPAPATTALLFHATPCIIMDSAAAAPRAAPGPQ
jgi:hypothetical protein